MENLDEQIKHLTQLDGHKEELLEASMLEESRQQEKITTVDLLNQYTDIEKEKLDLEVEMKTFILENKVFAQKMNEFKQRQTELENKQADLKAKMVQTMPLEDKKNESNGVFKVTYVAPTTKSSFDTKKFKEENEKLYEKYVSKSDVSAYVKVSKA